MSGDEGQGGPGAPGGFDMNAMFGQIMESAKAMQGKVAEAQDKAKELVAEGEAGGGLVKVQANGAGRILSVRIDKIAVDPRDIEMLEDLVVAACNVALGKASELAKKELGNAAGGVDLDAMGLGGLGSLLGG